jgi:CheY-like chemotaxis protein
MKILVIESEELVLKNTGVMLGKLGYKAALAGDCKLALRTFTEEGPFDVVLIALKFMRGTAGGGAKLMDAMLQKNPKQNFAYMTSAPVLRKPFTLLELDEFMGAFRRPASSRFE